MSNELKPCPFCGGEAKIEDKVSQLTICCSKCSICNLNANVFFCMDDSHKKTVREWAIKDWNTRTESTELEQLRKALEEIKAKCEANFDDGCFTGIIEDIAGEALAKLNQQGE